MQAYMSKNHTMSTLTASKVADLTIFVVNKNRADG